MRACSEMVRRWRVLQALQDRNETLFYNVLVSNIVEMAPIIYTPTVGWVCMNYHMLFQKPRGLYICATDRGEITSVVWNWPTAEVDAIVVTDGSRILGLGDLGLNGMGASARAVAARRSRSLRRM
jgi:malate dehydrogenase (decarboxylating)